MSKPIVENIDKWTHHYESMAKGEIPFEDMYVLNQQGHGLGNHKRSKVIYKIQKSGQELISPKIISPVAQGIDQAESMVKKKRSKSINTKTRRKRSQSLKRNCTQNKTKG